MPPLIAAAGGFITALTAGAVAFGAPTAAFAFGVSAAAFIATPLGGLLLTGALLGAQKLLAGQTASQTAGINSPEVRGSIRQSVPPQRVVYGKSRIGGALFFHDDATPPYLIIGLLLSRRRISAVNAVHIGDLLSTFDGLGFATTSPFHNGTESRFQKSFRNGSTTQAIDPIIAAYRTDIPSTFRQRGHSTFVFRSKYGVDADDFEAMWGTGVSIPNILLDVDGAPVHDPREPTSDPEDETTWPFRNTAALVQADWLRQPYGGRIDQSRLRWDEIADAANYDDELVGLSAGGFEKRYTIDGVVTLDQTPVGVMQAMLTANRGFVATHQGRIWITSSKPLDPVLTITDAMLRGGFEYHRSGSKKGLLNKVRTRFVAPDREYDTADGPILDRTDLAAIDGETLEATLGLPFTLGDPRAQRLAKLELDSSRLERGLTANLPLRTLGLRPGQVARVESVKYPRMNGLYLVRTIGFSADYMTRPVTLTEYDGTLAGQWAPATDQKPFVLTDI